jgi:hypothetical protein
MTPFKNPYDGMANDDLLRTTILVSRKAHGELFQVRPQTGTLQTTINILIDKFTNELKRNGITSYEPELYERACADCTIILGGTVGVPTSGPGVPDSTIKTPSGDDRRRTKPVARRTKRTA